MGLAIDIQLIISYNYGNGQYKRGKSIVYSTYRGKEYCKWRKEV